MLHATDAELVLVALWSLVSPAEAAEPGIGRKSVSVGRSELARACASVRELNQRHIEAAIHRLAGSCAIDIVRPPTKGRSGAALYELLEPPVSELTVISHQVGLGSASMLQHVDAQYRVRRAEYGLLTERRRLPDVEEWTELRAHDLLMDVVLCGPVGLLYRANLLAFVAGKMAPPSTE